MRNGRISVLMLAALTTAAYAQIPPGLDISGGVLYLAPQSNNLKYAVFVSGHQPYSQSWHDQEVTPGYSPSFELGLGYMIPSTPYRYSIDWLHLETSDSNSKQASQSIDPSNVQFVAPPYDVGPAVFGIKRGASTAQFDFDNIQLNVGKLFEYCPNIRVQWFGGINILRINQTIKTKFSDFAGMAPTTVTYGLPPDPSFYFKTKSSSDYLGAGPEIGVNVQYTWDNGFGFTGQFITAVTAGRMSVADKFTSASQRLTAIGIPVSHQEITTPTITQVVPGVDARGGLLYRHIWNQYYDMTIEAGYRIAYYHTAFSEIMPSSLVQPGTNFGVPEFSTGTMAINTTESRFRPFTYNGPYLNLKLAFVC